MIVQNDFTVEPANELVEHPVGALLVELKLVLLLDDSVPLGSA